MINENKKRTATYRAGDRLSASWVQKVENFISTFNVLSGGQFFFDGKTASLQIFGLGGGAGGKYAFGIKSFNGEKLNLYKGLIKKGNAIVELSEAEITVTGDPSFIVLKVNKQDIAQSGWILNGLASVPGDTATIAHFPFYEYRNVSSAGKPVVLKLAYIHRSGSIFL